MRSVLRSDRRAADAGCAILMTRIDPRWVAPSIVLLCLTACQRSEPTDVPAKPEPSNTAAPTTTSPAAQSASPVAETSPASAANATTDASSASQSPPTVVFTLPQTIPVGKAGDTVFTIAEAAIEPRNSESMRLVLLVRMMNKQGQATEFTDRNFRLVTQDSVITANGGLGETVEPGAESRLERVQFLVPMNSVPRALKLEFGGETIELPLTFKR